MTVLTPREPHPRDIQWSDGTCHADFQVPGTVVTGRVVGARPGETVWLKADGGCNAGKTAYEDGTYRVELVVEPDCVVATWVYRNGELIQGPPVPIPAGLAELVVDLPVPP